MGFENFISKDDHAEEKFCDDVQVDTVEEFQQKLGEDYSTGRSENTVKAVIGSLQDGHVVHVCKEPGCECWTRYEKK